MGDDVMTEGETGEMWGRSDQVCQQSLDTRMNQGAL